MVRQFKKAEKNLNLLFGKKLYTYPFTELFFRKLFKTNHNVGNIYSRSLK